MPFSWGRNHSGSGCDTRFLFSCIILGDYEERLPRHAEAYRNFLVENQRLQEERIAAFRQYATDVNEGRFPASCQLIGMEDVTLDEVRRAIEWENLCHIGSATASNKSQVDR